MLMVAEVVGQVVMVSLKGENPISGDDIDATSTRDWMRYGVGGVVVVGSLMAAKGVVSLADDRLGISENVEEFTPELS